MRCYNETISIIPSYHFEDDTYFGNTKYGRDYVSDIQDCLYSTFSPVIDRLHSVYCQAIESDLNTSQSSASTYEDYDSQYMGHPPCKRMISI